MLSSAAAPTQPRSSVRGWERTASLPVRPSRHAFAVRDHTSASAGHASARGSRSPPASPAFTVRDHTSANAGHTCAWEGHSRPAKSSYAVNSHTSATAGHASATASHASAFGLASPVSSLNALGAATEATPFPSKLLPCPCRPDGADATSSQRCLPAVRIRKVRPAMPPAAPLP